MTCTEDDLLCQGWQRCFIADEPRLSEAVETYKELGYEVALLPVGPLPCDECLRATPERYRVIFIRKL